MREKVVCLVSGGIDSPVATWLIIRKGYRVFPLFSYGGVDDASLKRFLDVCKVLKKWQRNMRCFIYKANYDLLTHDRIVERHAYILERRIMLRVAEALANKLGAFAIATGDSLAQVSSQTLENLYVIDKVCKLPVLRPLIGFNKDEIVKLARKIGTFEISIRKVKQECGSLPACVRKPVTKAKLEVVEKIEKRLGIEEIVKKCIKNIREVQLI